MSERLKQTGDADRICILVDRMDVGGIEMLAVILCRSLLRQGCRVDLICLHLNKTSDRMFQRIPAGARTPVLQEMYPHRQGMFSRWLDRILSSFLGIKFTSVFAKQTLAFLHLGALARGMTDYIEAERPDAIYSTSNKTNIIALLGRRAAKRKPRCVVSLHLRLRSVYSDRINWIKFALISCYLPKADAVHAVSRGLAEEAARQCRIKPEKITVVYNPMFSDDLHNLKQQKCDHPWIAGKNEAKSILWAGRPEDLRKDLKTLLRAFRLLCERREARLIVLGASPDRCWMTGGLKQLYDGLEDRILMHGYVKNPYSWMAGADVFVLSSKSEGLPTVLIEAMACGCPVVSTDCEHGPREILEDGRWGRLTPVGDARALADAIDATLDNPPPAEELIARARDFSEERIMPQFMEMLGLPQESCAC